MNLIKINNFVFRLNIIRDYRVNGKGTMLKTFWDREKTRELSRVDLSCGRPGEEVFVEETQRS